MSEKVGRILVVDDEPIARDIFTGIFEDEFRVMTASSGGEALEVIGEFLPDVVILDAVMPGIDGWEVCRRIKTGSKIRDAKVIMVSANAIEKKDRQVAYSAGADDYLVKPFIGEDLFAKVHLLLRNRCEEEKLKAENLALEKRLDKIARSNEMLEARLEQRSKDLLQTTIALQDAQKRQKELQEASKLYCNLLRKNNIPFPTSPNDS